jgi:hypothetical protein
MFDVFIFFIVDKEGIYKNLSSVQKAAGFDLTIYCDGLNA